jgi:hypothetical protein
MDQSILSKLGGYLQAHREEIVGEWLPADSYSVHGSCGDVDYGSLI